MTISGFVAYVKQMWKNKPDTSTPLTGSRLTHVEDGVKGNSNAIEKIAAAVVSQIVNDPNKIASMAALFSVKQQVDQQNSDLGGKFPDATKLYLKKDGYIGASQILKNSSNTKDYGTYISDYSTAYNTDMIIHDGIAKLVRTDTSGNSVTHNVILDSYLSLLNTIEKMEFGYDNNTAGYEFVFIGFKVKNWATFQLRIFVQSNPTIKASLFKVENGTYTKMWDI